MQCLRAYAKVTLSMDYAALPQQQAFPRGLFYTLERTEEQMLLICSASKTKTIYMYSYIVREYGSVPITLNRLLFLVVSTHLLLK